MFTAGIAFSNSSKSWWSCSWLGKPKLVLVWQRMGHYRSFQTGWTLSQSPD